jgi:hypothetical protein
LKKKERTVSNRPNVTSVNASEYRQALKSLRDHLDDLAEMTRQCPVVCSFGGFHTIFTSREDIVRLIEDLDRTLAAFDAEFERRRVEFEERARRGVRTSRKRFRL